MISPVFSFPLLFPLFSSPPHSIPLLSSPLFSPSAGRLLLLWSALFSHDYFSPLLTDSHSTPLHYTPLHPIVFGFLMCSLLRSSCLWCSSRTCCSVCTFASFPPPSPPGRGAAEGASGRLGSEDCWPASACWLALHGSGSGGCRSAQWWPAGSPLMDPAQVGAEVRSGGLLREVECVCHSVRRQWEVE